MKLVESRPAWQAAAPERKRNQETQRSTLTIFKSLIHFYYKTGAPLPRSQINLPSDTTDMATHSRYVQINKVPLRGAGAHLIENYGSETS